MTAKEYLSQIRRDEARMRSRLQQLEALKRDAASLKAITYDGVRVVSSPSGGSLAKIEELVDIEAQLRKDLVEMCRRRYRITREIEQLSDLRYQELLIKRYVEQKGLRDIADEMGYSYQTVRRLHGHALLAFQRQISYINQQT